MKKQTLIASAVLLGLLAGCNTTSNMQGDKFGAKITQLRETVAETSDSIGGVIDNLDALLESVEEDPRLAYNAFSKSVDTIGKSRDSAVSKAESLTTAGESYFAERKESAAEIVSPEIRKASLKRAKEAEETFAKIAPLFEEANAQIDPLLAEARDLRTLLSQDITPAGIDSARAVIKSTRDTLKGGKAKLDETIEELEAIEAEFIAPRAEVEEDEEDDDD